MYGMLGMLESQACRQHAGDRKWHAVEMIKNALNLCNFSYNQATVAGRGDRLI